MVDISISISIMLVILYVVGFDGRRPGLSNAPLDRSPRYDNHDTHIVIER